ncbi:unnamed protein product [Tilletia laevis]|uniref:Uncharacterized protein n=2 Tax=Tilletia TaxID=13289 RepID=A0A9N8QMM9_9BASI|nr:hypothetical protein CF335_g7596 [Tilletia laevis]CAD6885068.1 unnamed protein product [Tilletia caries]CAD6976836.1 unnamed protein product [Tilletia controversa]KAE8192874.1 hypothetical protein CF336_g4242 [Tilletia laevis]CAD6902511.1 unnamed protein product [Tilletia laevis]
MSSESIYDRFNLLPAPPPTAFSHHGPAVRMRLPDFQTVQDARDFLDKMFVCHHSALLTGTRTTFASLVAVLCIFVVGWEVSLYVHRRRWFLRIVKTPEGVIIVPNNNAVWATFGPIFLALNCIQAFVELAYLHRDLPLPHMPLWVILQFVPLSYAMIWSSWASYHGRVPGSQHYELLHRESRGLKLSPFAANCVWIVTPTVLAVIVAIPAFLSDAVNQSARRDAILKMAEMSTATYLSEELIRSIQELWLRRRSGAELISIGTMIWYIILLGYIVVYASISFRLAIKLHQHLSALLQIKQARAAVGTVQIECSTSVVVSPYDERVKRWFPDLPLSTAVLVEEKDDVLITSPTVGLFPNVAPGSARHEPLGDGQGFRKVLWLFGLHTGLITIGAVIFAGLALAITVVSVDLVEINDSEKALGIGFLVTQLIAASLGTMISVCNTILDHSEAFQTLMHGTYRVGTMALQDQNRRFHEQHSQYDQQIKMTNRKSPSRTSSSSTAKMKDPSDAGHACGKNNTDTIAHNAM